MADITDKFAGLPLGLLVCTPIIEVAKGQSELCRVYLDYVYKLAFIDGDPEKGTKTLSFNLTRQVTDGSGNITPQQVTVTAPLISLVPVPAFTMDEATVRFTMEVKEQVVDKSNTSATPKWIRACLSGDSTHRFRVVSRPVPNIPARPTSRPSMKFMHGQRSRHLPKGWRNCPRYSRR